MPRLSNVWFRPIADVRGYVPSGSSLTREPEHAVVYTLRLDRIGALGLLAAVHQLRGMEWSPQPISDYLIGVLPNFAAAIAITFVLLSIWGDQNPKADFTSAKRPFILCASISGFGLFAWELFQKTSRRLVFDPHDVAATLVGLGTAGILFYLIRPASPKESK